MKQWIYYNLSVFSCWAFWLLFPLNCLFYQPPQVEEKAASLSKSNKLTYVSYLMRGISLWEVYFLPEFPGLRPPYQLQFGFRYFVGHSFHAQGFMWLRLYVEGMPTSWPLSFSSLFLARPIRHFGMLNHSLSPSSVVHPGNSGGDASHLSPGETRRLSASGLLHQESSSEPAAYSGQPLTVPAGSASGCMSTARTVLLVSRMRKSTLQAASADARCEPCVLLLCGENPIPAPLSFL